MPVSFSDLQLAFEFVSSGGMGENEAYLDRQSGQDLLAFGVRPTYRWREMSSAGSARPGGRHCTQESKS